MDGTVDLSLLASAGAQMAVVVVVVNLAKGAAATALTADQVSALAPLLSLLCGVVVGVFVAAALGTDVIRGAGSGFVYGLLATGAYRLLPAPVKGASRKP